MIIFMQDIIFILKLDAEMLDINICVNLMKMSSFLQKYDLNMILLTLMQCVNSLTTVTII